MINRWLLLLLLPCLLFGQFYTYLPFEYQTDKPVSSRVILTSQDTLNCSYIKFNGEYVYGMDTNWQTDDLLEWTKVRRIEFNLDLSFEDLSNSKLSQDLIMTTEGELIPCAVLEISKQNATFVRPGSRKRERLNIHNVDFLNLSDNTKPNPFAELLPPLAANLDG